MNMLRWRAVRTNTHEMKKVATNFELVGLCDEGIRGLGSHMISIFNALITQVVARPRDGERSSDCNEAPATLERKVARRTRKHTMKGQFFGQS